MTAPKVAPNVAPNVAPKAARKVAIIGAGMIGEVHRRSAHSQGAEIIGVLASTPSRSQEVAERWGVAQAFSSIEELALSDAEVVHVCSPNNTHLPYVTVLAQAGKNIILEKPVGRTADEAKKLQAVATDAGVIITVPFVYRYHPMVREIRARRLRGDLGELNLVHGSYLQDWLVGADASSWRVDSEVGGPSRAFADIGSHWCDLVEWVSGETFVSVNAATSIAYSSRQADAGKSFAAGPGQNEATTPVFTEDIALAHLRSSRGMLASVTVSQVAAGRKNRLWFELDGSTGSAVFDQENPEYAWFGALDESVTVARGSRSATAQASHYSKLPAGHVQGFQDCFDAFVDESYRLMSGEELSAEEAAGLPTLADGMRSARLVDALLGSAASGIWTSIEGQS